MDIGHIEDTVNYRFIVIRMKINVNAKAVAAAGAIVILFVIWYSSKFYRITFSSQNTKKTEKQGSNDSGQEFERFSDLISKWPSGKPKAVIYTLVHTSAVYTKVIEALQQMEENFNNQYGYPVILFHEPDLNNTEKLEIRKRTNSDIYFQEVNFKMPAWVKTSKDNWRCLFPPAEGYRHMCRFHTKLVYEHPIILKVTWYLRLDDDSHIFRPIRYDIFKYMEHHSFTYGYIFITNDITECVEGLRGNSTKYITENRIKATSLANWPELTQVYNNFEISRVDFWRSEPVQKFIDFIDKSGHIYDQRWGDAPIHTTIVMTFLNLSQIHQFTDIYYQHQLEISGLYGQFYYYHNSISMYVIPIVIAAAIILSIVSYSYWKFRRQMKEIEGS